jgi:diacylglycerol O-acyltransferase
LLAAHDRFGDQRPQAVIALANLVLRHRMSTGVHPVSDTLQRQILGNQRHMPDPQDQLQTVHSRLTRAKGSGQWQAGHVFISAANIIPFPLTAWAVRAASRLPQRGVVTVATNVPGPRQQMQIMGRNVVRMFPVPPIALGLRTGIAIVSYADKIAFGITGDYDTAPDVDDIARGIERAVARLAALRRPA